MLAHSYPQLALHKLKPRLQSGDSPRKTLHVARNRSHRRIESGKGLLRLPQRRLDFVKLTTMLPGMKLVLLIAVPAAVGLIVLSEPLVATIFYGGAFSADDVRMTALALQAFAIGLVGFSFVKILAPAYFARHDTRTPVRMALIALAVNFVLSVLLAWYLTRIGYAGNHAGLALAISVAALLNAWLLYRGLRRDGVLKLSSGWGLLLLQTLVASAVMALTVIWLNRPTAWWIESAVLTRVGWLSVTIGAGAGIYGLVLLALGLRFSNLGMRPR